MCAVSRLLTVGVLQVWESPGQPACHVAFSPDGKLIVSGSRDTLVKIFHADTGAEVRGGVLCLKRVVEFL